MRKKPMTEREDFSSRLEYAKACYRLGVLPESQGVPLATAISQLQNAMIELSRTIEALRAEVKALKATKFTVIADGRCYYEEIK